MRNWLVIAPLLTSLLAALSSARADDASAAETALVSAYLIQAPDEVQNVLIADSENARLLRMRRNGDGFSPQDERYMSVGQNGVGKVRAWDRKTPLGIYFITEELDTSRLAAKYGVAAFVLDYPNAWDQYNERTGYGIWLHGVDPALAQRPARDTDGCLALPNDELTTLATHLRPHETPVIITRKVRWSTVAEMTELRRQLNEALDAWKSARLRGDLHAFLALYDEAFTTTDMTRAEWAAFHLAAFDANPVVELELDDVLLVRDPEAEDLILSRFEQTVQTAGGPLTVRKRLYWVASDSGWKIIAEDAG